MSRLALLIPLLVAPAGCSQILGLKDVTVEDAGADGAAGDGTAMDGGTMDATLCTATFLASIPTPIPIPDADEIGITSPISVTGDGSVASLMLSLAIVHPVPFDLAIELISPIGTEFVIRDEEDGPPNVIINDQVISVFSGQLVAGTWRLEVQDLGFEDVGTLNSWSLTISRNCSAIAR